MKIKIEDKEMCVAGWSEHYKMPKQKKNIYDDHGKIANTFLPVMSAVIIFNILSSTVHFKS